MFQNTEQALEYGLKMHQFDRHRLTSLRQEYIRQATLAADREQFNLAIMFAVQAQLCREAIAAAKGAKGL